MDTPCCPVLWLTQCEAEMQGGTSHSPGALDSSGRGFMDSYQLTGGSTEGRPALVSGQLRKLMFPCQLLKHLNDLMFNICKVRLFSVLLKRGG